MKKLKGFITNLDENKVAVQKTLFRRFSQAVLQNCTLLTNQDTVEHLSEIIKSWANNFADTGKISDINELEIKITEFFDEFRFIKELNEWSDNENRIEKLEALDKASELHPDA
jgi:hypothetical protein